MKLINKKRTFLKNRSSILWILLLLSITAITACSSGSSLTKAGVDESSNANVLTGIFLDSPVEGLNYQTATMNGITDDAGTFMYHDGETIAFYIGDVMLGAALAKHLMTPIDLVPEAVDETHPTVTNICRLLQSLDWDGDLTNGIMITDAMHTEISGRMVDFSKSPDEFFDYDVEAFFNTMHILGVLGGEGDRGFRTPADAQNHFRQTLMDNMHNGGS
jgi:hypothetical protein